MSATKQITLAGTISAAILVTAGTPAVAASHLWRFNEIFSNPDGTVQFIEMRECCGADFEISLAGKWIRSDATTHLYIFPEDLLPPSGHRFLLLATAGFANLPGAPTPDFIFPDGFFAIEGDTLRYWLYSPATMTFGPGDLPLDGIRSLNIDGSTGVNSPTNYAGQTGSIVPGDSDGDGDVDLIDYDNFAGCATGPAGPQPPPTCDLFDFNRDGHVDLRDFGAFQMAFSG